MPTYTIKYSNIKLSNNQKKRIAESITKVHHLMTGANKFFAQVIFQQNKSKSHFMGGKVVKTKEIFLNGQIRGGRSPKVKKKLIKGLELSIRDNTNLSKDNIWVYLEELIPDQMIEYGEILPKSGNEKRWFKTLSQSLKNRLKKIDNN